MCSIRYFNLSENNNLIFDNYRFRLRRVVESLFFRVVTFLLIFIDVAVVIADLVQNPETKNEVTPLQIVDLIITVWFVVELILR